MARLVSTRTELVALRALCSKNKKVAGSILAHTDETFFHNEEARLVYNRIRQTIVRAGEAPVWRELQDDPSLDESAREFIEDVEDRIQTVDESKAAIKILDKYRKLRGLYLIAEDVIEEMQAKKVDEATLIERMGDALAKLRVSKSLRDIALHIGKGNNSYEVVRGIIYDDAENNFLPTGFRDFDSRNHGITYGSLFLVGGSTGAGKSAVAAQLAKFWASIGERVVLVPLEMSKEEMTSRLLANISRIDVRKIIFKRLTDDEKAHVDKSFRRYARRAAVKGGRYTIFKPDEDMSIEEILSVASTYGPRVIIIDYMSLLKGVGGDDSWQKLGAAARYGKIWASNNNCIVVILAQVSEEGKVRYAQAIREHSDYGWIFVATKESRENEIINVEQTKGRNAELFPFSLAAKLSIMQIGDIKHEDEPTEASEEGSSKRTKKSARSYVDDVTDAE